jgi:enolase
MKIKKIDALQIFDSRGMPTIECEVTLENGVTGRGVVPSGASTGQYEALELRDGIKNKFRGKSVYKAISHIQGELQTLLIGKSADDQNEIDEAMIILDGTPNKSRLGANAILGVSLAVAHAKANAKNIPLFKSLGNGNLLPLPEIQLIGGGAHANWRTDIQDFLIIAMSAKTYEEALEMTFNVYHAAADLFKAENKYFGVADEGGFWPEFSSNEGVFDRVVEAIKKAGYIPGKDIAISLDVAASDLYDEKTDRYELHLENRTFSSEEFCDLMIHWCQKYPVISVEDMMADTDWKGWKRFTNAMSGKLQIIGDDLFTTNIQRIQQGIDQSLANSVLIKLNQIGTVSETLKAIEMTQKAGWLPVVSARSGETEDAFIAHLATATNAGQLKVGSFTRSERMVKWNEVLRIQKSLGTQARFIGSQIYQVIGIKNAGN